MIKTLKISLVGVMFVSGLTTTFANSKDAQNIEFPELSQSYEKVFQRYTVQNLKLLSLGLNKDQVRHILGAPSFNEGIFAVRTWNYIVDVQNPVNNAFKRCQLRIDFDQKYLTKAFYWKGEECQELLKYGTTQEKPVVLPKPEMSIRQANIFFQFDRSDLNGAMSNISLAEIIREIKKSNSTRISIQGYADTLGKDTYNQRLSEHRTSSLVAYLIAQGIPSQYILVDAHGSTEQYKQCQSEPSHAEKVNCLAPNRRVSIAW